MGKRTVVLLTALILAASMLVGCGASSGSGSATKDNKQTVRIGLWGQNMLVGVAPALREAFPDVNFEFIVAHNSTEYYQYMNDHDVMPDLLTVRRFSLLDAVDLKDTLVDLSDTDLAASYYQNYLKDYTFDDGVVNWLPAVAEVQCIIANKSLFERCGVELPTDYASFVSACNRFNELGIIPFANEWDQDFGCLEVLEGINADTLQSLGGRQWRASYESGKVAGLDASVWKPAFARMAQFLNDSGSAGAKNLDGTLFTSDSYIGILDGMNQGTIAMCRNGGAAVGEYNANNEDEYVMLPYFGDTADQNWVLTYPYYQAAINSKSSVDQKLLMEILCFMLSQKGQDALGVNANMLSYSKDVTTSPNAGIQSLNSYLDANKLFVRLANNRFFSASKDVVGKMITGELDADQAYNAFDQQISAPATKPENDVTIEKGYTLAFDSKHGSQAASAVANTVRSSWGCDFVLMYGTTVTNSIYAGPAASSQLKYTFSGMAANPALLTLTGEELTNLVSTMVGGWDAKVDKNYGYPSETAYVPHENYGLPVSSGFEMQVTKNGTNYVLDGITVNGQPLDKAKTYTVALCVTNMIYSNTLKAAGITDQQGCKNVLPATITTYVNWIKSGKQPVEPTDYIALESK